MGAQYYIGCKTCGVKRSLDKICLYPAKNQKDVHAFAYDMVEGDNGYRIALLASFLGEHIGHDCVVFSEAEFDAGDEYSDTYFKKEKSDFWEPREKIAGVSVI